MKNKRHNHSAAFKAKVALEAVKKEKIIAEQTSQFLIRTSAVSLLYLIDKKMSLDTKV